MEIPIGDGIALVYGLNKIQNGEMIECANNVNGMTYF
jgi:F0F1-type ATP synthase alpha subunit